MRMVSLISADCRNVLQAVKNYVHKQETFFLLFRTVLCNNPEMTLIPGNIPDDTLTLVIERTLVRHVSAQAFSSASRLECLRLAFNSISEFSGESLQGLIRLRELRLNDNALSTFPWEALSHLPRLWLLDLHNNVLSSFPSQAGSYFKNITYLDLSSNRLRTLSTSDISMWLVIPPTARVILSTVHSKLIIGLHNNSWDCDCWLSELVHFVKMQQHPTSILMDPGLKCSRPEHLSGALFSSIELSKCQSPSIRAAESKVTAVPGTTVSLHCATTGVPSPTISWSRTDNMLLNGTGGYQSIAAKYEGWEVATFTWSHMVHSLCLAVIQEYTNRTQSGSTLSLDDISYQDSGEYLCRASNLMGTSGAMMSLLVVDSAKAKVPIKSTAGWRCPRKLRNQKAARRSRKLMAQYMSMLTNKVSPREMPRGSYSSGGTDYFTLHQDQLDTATNAPEFVSLKMNPSKITSLSENRRSVDESSNVTLRPSLTTPEADCLVRTVRVIGGTYHSVSLAWRSPKATNVTLFSILYTTFGERDMKRINVGPGKTKITIDGLMPQNKYIVCVCVKGIIPRKEQCVIFSTDEVAHASGTQKLINGIVITVACVIVIPLTLIVCCGALKRRCRKFLIKPPEDDDQNNSFAPFESLAMGPRPDTTEEDYLTNHDKDEANRLLSPRSSFDSEEATINEAQQNEYFC
ncbi:leucine-rich repeat, immunoglobulin-like domain and transmembrane domain-containing protein 1a [Leucoraja erinacea]|uniref:leucine-rich repeat, immunoglobulin-like domain and transmembrane domain-containing protein 1a n=1 Tax=Leucoraja erinaceus TaxID=7782 RepID=UPI0024568947|nr:leucine-rich repeat, immunoglobulin-like domain and transmembrane domain-containing protein 1a [Leucoraja erinacea]